MNFPEYIITACTVLGLLSLAACIAFAIVIVVTKGGNQ